MKRHGFLPFKPILVVQSEDNPGKLKVIDGQNRIEACTLRPGDRIKIHPDGVEM